MSDDTRHLDDLIAAALDGHATDAQLVELNRRIAEDDAACDRYLEAVDLHAALASDPALAHRRATGTSSLRLVGATGTRTVVSRLVRWSAAIAAMLGLAAGVLFMLSDHDAATTDRVTLIRSVGGTLTSDAGAIQPHEAIGADEVRLSEGVAELAYGPGVRVVIEAPARFRCESPRRLHLYEGKLAADVAEEGVGFTVVTPESDIVDLGTKFGVDVSDGRASEVHVFQGKVKATSGDKRQEATLTEGRAARVEAPGRLSPRMFRNGAFVHAEELASLAAAWSDDRVGAWRAAVEQLKRDPAIIAYFGFERRGDGGTIEHDGKVHGAQWVQGRFPGKDALEFKSAEDHVRVDIGGSYPRLTIMTWVRLDRMPDGYNSMYHTDDWNTPGQLHWMVLNDKRMRLAVRPGGNGFPDGPKGERRWPESNQSIIAERGRWVHLAVVYDADARAARFYINGVLDNEQEERTGLPAWLGPAVIGNWDAGDFAGGKLPDRRLSGRMDELVFVARVMTDAEIRAYFEAGTPYPVEAVAEAR